jgi:outer membrane receptor protein involved in Fe transport
VGAGVDFSSKTYFQFPRAQPLAPIGKSHELVDARIGIKDDDDKWDLALVANNLLDERYIIFATAVSASGGAYYGQYNRPRVISLQLNLRH